MASVTYAGKGTGPARDWSFHNVEVASRVIVGVVTFIRLGSGQAVLSPWSLEGVAWVG